MTCDEVSRAIFVSSSILGPSWGHLGAILAYLGPRWPFLERSWAVFGRSWSHLGASLVYLEPSWGHLGVILGPFLPYLGQSWAVLGRSWGHLGAILACLRLLLLVLLGTLIEQAKITMSTSSCSDAFFSAGVALA